MDENLVGFVALGALIVGLFIWFLRQDVLDLREQVRELRAELSRRKCPGGANAWRPSIRR